MNRKKILVSTDLTPQCDVAIKKAMELATKYDRWLEILHVINPPLFEICVGSECMAKHVKEEEVRKNKEIQISERIKSGLKRASSKLNIKTRVGEPAEEIIKYAKDIEATAIIMADTHEEYGPLKKFFLGTNIKRVVANSHIPVLVVKEDKSPEYKKIMIPVDYTEECKDVIKYTANLFPDAELYLLNIMEIPSDFRLKFYGLNDTEITEITKAERTKAKNRMVAFINELGINNEIHEVVCEGALLPERVVDEAKKAKVDLVSVYAHDINDLATKVIGGISSEILDLAETDVLVYQEA